MLFIILAFGLFFGLFFYNKLVFRVITVDPKIGETTSETITVIFNKEITNKDEIYETYSIKPLNYTILIIEKNKITIRPTTYFDRKTDYIVSIPNVKSNRKEINNLEIRFKSGDSIVDNYSSSESLNYKKNMEKYSFMNNQEEIVKDSFTISINNTTTSDPTFVLILIPEIEDYSNQELKLNSYKAAFLEFEKYIKSFGFKYQDLKLSLYPGFIESDIIPDSLEGIE